MTTVHPEAVRVNTKAFSAGLRMSKVLKHAGVGRSTWWRVRSGYAFNSSTIQRIDDAIEELTRAHP